MQPTIGQRVILLIAGRELDATVLGVVTDPAYTTEDGCPALNLAYFDESKATVLGTPAWPEVFTLLSAVKHEDHDDVIQAKEGHSWLAVETDAELQRIGEILKSQAPALVVRRGDTASGLVQRLVDQKADWERQALSAAKSGPVTGGAESVEFGKEGIEFTALSAEETHKAVFDTLDEGRIVGPSNGMNLGDFIDSVNDWIVQARDTKGWRPAQIGATPPTETKNYTDGSSATGPAPLPDHSPEGAPEAIGDNERAAS